MNRIADNIIEKLREAKEVKGLSYQDITDITEENGEYVSVSSVKRVFAKNSDISNFRYNQTIRPIVRAVLGLDEETAEPTDDPNQPEEYYTTIEAMKAVIEFKHQQLMESSKEIERLKESLNAANEAHKKELDSILNDSRLKIEHLKDQIAYLRSVNDHNARESADKSQIIKSLLNK
jgi:long-subunit acyl-CoA synthetase (AMP-forming)